MGEKHPPPIIFCYGLSSLATRPIRPCLFSYSRDVSTFLLIVWFLVSCVQGKEADRRPTHCRAAGSYRPRWGTDFTGRTTRVTYIRTWIGRSSQSVRPWFSYSPSAYRVSAQGQVQWKIWDKTGSAKRSRRFLLNLQNVGV